MYLFLRTNLVTLLNKPSLHNQNTPSLLLPPQFVFFFLTHSRLSSPYTGRKLTDLFAYETPQKGSNNPILVYLLSHQSFGDMIEIFTGATPLSCATIYSTTNWLERELGEMHGLTFGGKSDVRNLMLPYGDSSAPLQKALPSIGLREIFYNSSTDAIEHRAVSIQF